MSEPLIWDENMILTPDNSALINTVKEHFKGQISSPADFLAIIKTADGVLGNSTSAALGRGSEEISGVKCEDATTLRDSSTTSITSLMQDVKEEKTF